MPGETIAGRYRLLEPLGRGAMSSVWLAHDDELDRKVAVKLLGPSADHLRFEREARAAAALSDPNLSAVYDYGEHDGRPYMVLEYLPNGSLEERLQRGVPLPDAESERIATQIASGLAHAHERGLVHRDLKPANVLFDAEDRAKIADFGIARLGGSGTLTEAGTVLGTAAYISPEQASGLPAGPQSDVYSFAVILFRMLTGGLPFVSTNAMELVRMHRDEQPPQVRELRADAPPRLAHLVDASLAKDPADRPADGAALLRALRGTGESAAIAATQVLRPRRATRRRGGAMVPLAALAFVLLAVGGALAVLVTRNGSPSPGATTRSPTLPVVPAVAPPSATTAAVTSTPATTTARTTSNKTTTSVPTTAPVTTAPMTTASVTTAPTTTAPLPATTAATTTAAVTTTAPATTGAGTTTAPTTAPTTTAGP